MTLATSIGLMAAGADGVPLLLRLGRSGRLVDIVTIGAVLLAVAVDTAQSEEIDMLLMVKCHGGAGLVRCVVNFFARHSDYGVGFAHDVGRIVVGVLNHFAIHRIMT